MFRVRKSTSICLRNSVSSLGTIRSKHLVFLSAHDLSSSSYSSSFSSSSSSSSSLKTENPYSKTIILPKTQFEQRANSVVKEPLIQKWWEDNKVYEKLKSSRDKSEKFILHDGPPYANGDLHIGHALNKVLKDVINRYKIMRGYNVRFIPGWDCHGLPIELKVLQSLKAEERKSLASIDLRKKAMGFVTKTVKSQMQSFKRYGVWGDWGSPYLTMDKEYEAAQIGVFNSMVEKGYIYRGRKPVHWSPSSKSALAEAELEYPPGHVSKSVYACFETTPGKGTGKNSSQQGDTRMPDSSSSSNSLSLLEKWPANGKVKLVVWTTTPWTLPANLAVAVNPDLNYCLVRHTQTSDYFVVSEQLLPTLKAKGVFTSSVVDPSFDSRKETKEKQMDRAGVIVIEEEGREQGREGEIVEIIGRFAGRALEGLEYSHPLYPEKVLQVVSGGAYITAETGTGLVHTAPGHGLEDYATGQKYGLPLLSPVDDMGKFTREAGERFEGKFVLKEGNEEVIEALRESGSLLLQEDYLHKYPYDWRTKKPTIFRATDQWFASVESIKEVAKHAIESVRWVPEIGKNRISSMTSSRSDWCISRQRSWGVPIPAFYNIETGEHLMDRHVIKHIQELFRLKGSNAWWALSVEELLPDCYKGDAGKYRKGEDTMDVWFDSGCSWAGVGEGILGCENAVDLYLEGSDQHRGWFQSSLLTSVATRGRAPYKSVLTHGFVLDERGQKMSKSLGNTVDPKVVIDGGSDKKLNPAYGADVLRLWVCSVDYSADVCIGSNILKQVSESYRKLRNTARYLVGNLFDFDPDVHSVPYDKLADIDKYIIGKNAEVMQEVQDAYERYQFAKVNSLIYKYAVHDLSNFYFDVSKDRLYVSTHDSDRRRSCQTALHIILESFAKVIGPILPHLAEDIWQHLPYEKPSASIFQSGWVTDACNFPIHRCGFWDMLRIIRSDVNKCLDKVRKDNMIGSSMEARVYLYVDKSREIVSKSGFVLEESSLVLKELLQGKDTLELPPNSHEDSPVMVDDLRFLFLTSQVNIVNSLDELNSKSDYVLDAAENESNVRVGVSKAAGKKCMRCWYYCTTVDFSEAHPGLCPRCVDTIGRHTC